jgi:argininosuccinate lyase
MSDNKSNQFWGGRFSGSTDAFVQEFTASIQFDQILYRVDIEGSLAHSQMLSEVGVLTSQERDAIHVGLNKILNDIEIGNFEWSVALEDIHMNIEARLIEEIGDIGKKLHTGRSRNDQVATDIRLYLRDVIDLASLELLRLQEALLLQAKKNTKTIMPGFTHLQVAQPISFGHHMMAWFEMLKRDYQRLQDCRGRVNVLPLGAAALAGTTYPIDRNITARLLSFDSVAENSLDAVSDRDFAIEFCADVALVLMHLSRFSEELVLWTSAQFDFIELPDRFCTGSSIMPQKKNPDVPELVRGKSGRANGNLISLLTLMKSQVLAYNKDNQEDKEPLFDSANTLLNCLRAYADMMPAIEVKKDKMYQAAKSGYSTATDLADYLVKNGVAFRDSHEIVGKAVAFGIKEKKDLSELSLDELKSFAPEHINSDVHDVLSLEGSINARDHLGGTAPAQVKKAVERGQQWLAEQLANKKAS